MDSLDAQSLAHSQLVCGREQHDVDCDFERGRFGGGTGERGFGHGRFRGEGAGALKYSK
jgi:hypothetical protein